MSDSLAKQVSDALRHLDAPHAEQPYADNQRWNAARVIRLQCARITDLETKLATARHCISQHQGGCINGCWEATDE